MKIPGSIRGIYAEQEAKYQRLKEAVDTRVLGIKDSRWHYESRVKELQSFTLKIETGRYRNPQLLEDFFACTLVVANTSEIDKAERLIVENFALHERRPRSKDKTHKRADIFTFDDLRLYLSIPKSVALPPNDLMGVVFELQIKTFLQHAWSIATHDLIYKCDDANWAKERIAYQTKAMLEHAEVSIQEAEKLSQCSSLAKEDSSTANIKLGIAMLKRQWAVSDLPADIRRLAQNITVLIDLLGMNFEELDEILNAGKAARSGGHPLNLSPYATILQYLFVAKKDTLLSVLVKEGQRKGILLPQEIEVPSDIDPLSLRNAIFVGKAAI